MSPRMGQKIKSNTKDIMLRTRIDKETYDKLDKMAEVLKVKKAEVVRRGIESLYNEIMDVEKGAKNERM